jgi:hypothetical protein
MSKRLVLVGLLILLVWLATPAFRFPHPSEAGFQVGVKKTVGPEGHSSITVDAASQASIVSFDLLGRWQVDPQVIPPPPPDIQALDKTRISLIGFMFPLAEGDQVKAFCLSATTQTCCYGPKPQFGQFVLVETAEPVPFERLRPVRVSGTFFVEARPQDGYIYRMTADTLEVAQQQPLALAAVPENAISLDWQQLIKLSPRSEAEFKALTLPPEITAYEGKTVVLGGHLLGENRTGTQSFMVAYYPWDGCCTGVPPQIFNSLLVFMATTTESPGALVSTASFSGILQINPREEWLKTGIITLTQAIMVGGN